jgi:hypothetical protein
MTLSDLPQTLSLKMLAYRCQQETTRFWEKLTYTPLFCLELFRRALSNPQAEGSKQAWSYIHQQYHRQVTLWVKRHRALAQTGLTPETLADLALEKMWVAFALTPDKLTNFPLHQAEKCLTALLQFLKTCVHSVVIDAIEKDNMESEDALADEGQDDPDPTIAADFWQAINRRLKDDKERLVMDALYVYGYKPQQIYDTYPQTFRNVKEIYRIKENILARLKRDPSLSLYQ